MKLVTYIFPMLLPWAVRWAEGQESDILARGVPLSEEGMADARAMGVRFPERVRVLKVDEVPMPLNSLLRLVAKVSGLLTPNTAGMALRYGIFVRKDYWGSRHIVAHECVHVAQYERLGGFRLFLKQYVRECLEVGYPAAPLEREAIERSVEVLRAG